ncbi:MAG: hypothetical protein AAF531_16630 [Actinomycetota bacterium]
MSQARSSRDNLSDRLGQVIAEHDLDKRELLTAERQMRRLSRIGAIPNPTEYWQRDALPRAAELVNASMTVIADEGELLADAIDLFFEPLAAGELGRWAETAEGRAISRQAAGRAVSMLAEGVEPSQEIHLLGQWWQQRLRRSAAVRSLPRLLRFGVDADAVIGRAELNLLDGPPWTHSDRLLSAFEIAHSEIRTQLDLVVEELTERVVGESPRLASSRNTITIELRG